MKYVTLILCATLGMLLLPTSADAVKLPETTTSVNTNPGGRATNASDEVTVPTADVCNCGFGNTAVQYARGSTPPAGTLRPAAAAAASPTGTGKANDAERRNGG